MNIPTGLKYTENDEWVRVEGDIGTIGITDFAQEQLSDVVFVEIIPAEGDILSQGDSCATVESVKAAADVYAPISGKVTAVNQELPGSPELVNSDPYGQAWMIKVVLSNPGELDGLMDAAAYDQYAQAKAQ
jgi:glycine cleavage system H protein